MLSNNEVNDMKTYFISFLYRRKAKEAFLKLRKERDYHRMHHKRVVQEKERLIAEVKK